MYSQAPRPVPSSLQTSYSSGSSHMMSEVWEKDNWTTFTIWDIDRAFQESLEAYLQIQQRSRRKRTLLQACFGINSEDDELARSLSLGRQVQEIMELGRDTIGSKFEKGDSTCHNILSAQLLRTQQEIQVPILDYTLDRRTTPLFLPIPLTMSLITTAKAIRRTCLQALRDQLNRMRQSAIPILPLPRFSVTFCPLALQLQSERTTTRLSVNFNFPTKKLRPHDRFDEREVCPDCNTVIAVASHSGLPSGRRWLFQSHLLSEENSEQTCKFSCTSCYKTFEDSYGFLDHVFQREIGSERSCQRRWSSCVDLNKMYIEYGGEKKGLSGRNSVGVTEKYLGTYDYDYGKNGNAGSGSGSGSEVSEWEIESEGKDSYEVQSSKSSEEDWGDNKSYKDWDDGYGRYDTYGRYSMNGRTMTVNRIRSIR